LLADLSPDTGDASQIEEVLSDGIWSGGGGGWSADGTKMLWWNGGNGVIHNIAESSTRIVQVDSVKYLRETHWLPDGRHVLSSKPQSGGKNRYDDVVWDTWTGQVVNNASYKGKESLGLQSRAATAEIDWMIAWQKETRCLKRYNTDTLETITMKCFDSSYPDGVVVSASSDMNTYYLNFASGDVAGPVLVWDVETGNTTEVLRRKEGEPSIGLVQPGGENHIYYSERATGTRTVEKIFRKNLISGVKTQVFKEIIADFKVHMFHPSPDGTHLSILATRRPTELGGGYNFITNLLAK